MLLSVNLEHIPEEEPMANSEKQSMSNPCRSHFKTILFSILAFFGVTTYSLFSLYNAAPPLHLETISLSFVNSDEIHLTASANSTVSSIFHAVRITNATCDISFNDDILGSVTATVNDGKSVTFSKDDPLPLDLTLHNIQLPVFRSFLLRMIQAVTINNGNNGNDGLKISYDCSVDGEARMWHVIPIRRRYEVSDIFDLEHYMTGYSEKDYQEGWIRRDPSQTRYISNPSPRDENNAVATTISDIGRVLTTMIEAYDTTKAATMEQNVDSVVHAYNQLQSSDGRMQFEVNLPNLLPPLAGGTNGDHCEA